jgi:hypothetical protein
MKLRHETLNKSQATHERRVSFMKETVQKHSPRFHLGVLFWLGLVIFAVGSGPLLVTILLAALGVTKDRNPNPVEFGIMAFFTFYPSLGLIIGGLTASFFRYCAAKKRFHNHEGP